MAKMMLSELIRIELVRLPGLHISAFTSAKRAQKHMFSIWTAPRDPKIKPIVGYKKKINEKCNEVRLECWKTDYGCAFISLCGKSKSSELNWSIREKTPKVFFSLFSASSSLSYCSYEASMRLGPKSSRTKLVPIFHKSQVFHIFFIQHFASFKNWNETRILRSGRSLAARQSCDIIEWIIYGMSSVVSLQNKPQRMMSLTFLRRCSPTVFKCISLWRA